MKIWIIGYSVTPLGSVIGAIYGFIERGIQIWCQRHQLNICHINFEGHKLESDFRCLEKKS